jgi:nitrogenase molybdenum-iron protein NifN
MAKEPAGAEAKVVGDVDFMDIGDLAQDSKADLVIGNSKGYKLSREIGIPLVRVGFPVHDRFGASRYLHVGYRGAQQLFDRIVNAVIEYSQESNPVGYTYI